jgi:hypothetical protein
MSSADIQGTAQSAALTIVALTSQAMPTNTPVPPTPTASPIPLPTDTPPPLPTLPTQEALATGVALPTTAAGSPFTQPTASGSGNSNQDPCNQALTAWQGPSASFNVANQTKPQGTIILSMYVVTDLGQCGYLVISGDSFTGPIGQYSAGAFISGKQNMKAFGSFRITEGSWKIVVKNDSISAAGGCYPNC